jgi:hypothetical protein
MLGEANLLDGDSTAGNLAPEGFPLEVGAPIRRNKTDCVRPRLPSLVSTARAGGEGAFVCRFATTVRTFQ